MIYQLRIKLSEMAFLFGKWVHPDLAFLRAQIKAAQEDFGRCPIILEAYNPPDLDRESGD